MDILTILGPTASGKTVLAAAVAARTGGEIISADSRQVYRRMDIGTGKDLSDYVVDGHSVAYHLIDICEPGTRYNLFRYQHDFRLALDDIVSRGRLPIICGGTGLYIEAVLRGYRLAAVPENAALRADLAGKSLSELTSILRKMKARNGSAMHNTTDVDTAQRAIRAIEIEAGIANGEETEGEATDRADVGQPLIVGISISRDERRRRITQRLKARLSGGMVEEVRALLDSGVPADDLIYYGLEYKYVTEHVLGLISQEEMFRRLEIAIHQFAKRQMTWFRGMERRGLAIHWIDGMMTTEQQAEQVMLIMNC